MLFVRQIDVLKQNKVNELVLLFVNMAVSKRKTSKSRNGMRQAGKGLVRKMNLQINNEGKIVMSHVVVFKRQKKQNKETVTE